MTSGITANEYRLRTQSGSTPRATSRAKAVNAYRSARTITPAFSIGRMRFSQRSAKSVACRMLKVVGVNMCSFLASLVVLFTRSDEFHSEKYTDFPRELSH